METIQQMQSIQQEAAAQQECRQPTYLMCPPDHFAVLYEINPWMRRAIQPDPERAQEQWQRLAANLEAAGARIEIIHPVPSLPDMVFTADIGLIDDRRFITSRFHHPQRQSEIQYGLAWFRSRNYEIANLALKPGESLESSDVCLFRGKVVAGYGFRTTASSHAALAQSLKCRVYSIEFSDPRLYHLDLSFCPLDERRALIAPAAWSHRSCAMIERLVPEPIVLELEEALTFCANAIVIGKTVIMPACPPRIGRILERRGFTICISPVGEFLKAGGAVHCLALALNISFSRASHCTIPLVDSVGMVNEARERSYWYNNGGEGL